MALTVSTATGSHDLTELATLKTYLGITVATDDALLSRLITAASRVIMAATGRVFAREIVAETFAGSDRFRLVLQRIPVQVVTTVALDGTALAATEYTLEEPAAGLLFRDSRWYSIRGATGGIIQHRTSEPFELQWQVDYTGGYLLPGSDVSATTISASSTDDSYNDSASGFPLLAAGDSIVVGGFVAGADNGTKTVVSRTAAKVIVSETLVTEAAGPAVTMAVETLPTDIEQAAIELVGSLYLSRRTNSGLKSESIGDYSYTQFGAGESSLAGLPPVAAAMLQPYVRISLGSA